MNIIINKYTTEQPISKEAFYEQVIGYTTINTLDYERNENWFILLIDSLYNLCPFIDTLIVADYVENCFDKYLEMKEKWLEEYKKNKEYPEFVEHH